MNKVIKFFSIYLLKGFGAYNFFLVLLLIPAAWANAIDLTKETFLLASAECDFQMTLIRKSLLVSAVYIGKYLI